jgi:5-methylcytosine-specific restriction endonuclease McrA
MNKRTRACAITSKVKSAVERRDGGECIFCHRPGRGEAHFISRAHGGLGVEENLLTVCRPCHDLLDNSQARNVMLKIAEAYLRERYSGWDKEKLIYDKWRK